MPSLRLLAPSSLLVSFFAALVACGTETSASAPAAEVPAVGDGGTTAPSPSPSPSSSSTSAPDAAAGAPDAAGPGLAFAQASPLSAGRGHACALFAQGRAKCWGLNTYGQLGQNDVAHRGDDPNEISTLAPIAFGVGRSTVAIEAGNDLSCAILDDGSVRCFGRNEYGQLGQGTATLQENKAMNPGSVPAVTLGARAVAVRGGQLFACALLEDGGVKCWGRNDYGQLGQSDKTNRMTQATLDALAPIALGGKAVAIAAGDVHACALLEAGTVKCWGNGGALGQDTAGSIGGQAGDMASLGPVFLGAGRIAKAITAGSAHTCALLDDGSVKCWGANIWGELGLGDQKRWGESPGDMQALPKVFLGAGRTALAIHAGATHTCAILDDRSVKCWGDNGSGQLGQDDVTRRGHLAGDMQALAPVLLGAGRTAKHLAAGHLVTCVWRDDDAILCWGDGNAGQLGQGDRASRGVKAGDMAALAAIPF